MKKYNLHLIKIEEVKVMCAHNKKCNTCPLFDNVSGKCPFSVAPENWDLE